MTNHYYLDIESFNETLLGNFIGDDNEVIKYLHNTSSEEIALKIMEEGFIFEKYIENSTDMVSGTDGIELRYFVQQRESYGHYTVVIQIGKEIVDLYFSKLQSSRVHFSEALSKNPPVLNADNDPIYTLPEQFVKGYFNLLTNQVIYNPSFNPHYISPIFDENVNRLINEV